jgi:hypothetical protein
MGVWPCREEGFGDRRGQAMTERRRVMRHGVAGNVFVTFRPNFDTVGIVTDISQRGIGFEYTSAASLCELPAATLDIFLDPLGFKLVGIPYKIAYDADADGEWEVANIRTRRCGVELTGLSRSQFDRLCELIHAHADSAAAGVSPGE